MCQSGEDSAPHPSQKPRHGLAHPQHPHARQQKIQQQAQPGAQKHEQMKLTLAAVQGKQQRRSQGADAVPQIQNHRQAAQMAAYQPQQVIVQPQPQAQHTGQAKLHRLQAQGILHQPNRRRSRPPSGCAAS